MIDAVISAILFSALIGFVVLFQLALVLGAPWGEMAMGGKHHGRLPPRLRVAALIQIPVLVFLALIVLSRAGVALDEFSAYSKSAIWLVVAFGATATIFNLITPSKKERMLWAPVSFLLLVCALQVAMS